MPNLICFGNLEGKRKVIFMPYRIIEETGNGIQDFEGRREQDSKQQTVFATLFAIAPVQERTNGQMADAISDMRKK